MSDNYIRQVLHSRELFLRYDQETMIRKFQLSADESYLYLPFLDRTYRICRKTGRIDTDGVECLDYNIAMTIYDILCCSKTAPVLAHQWCSLGSLQVTPSSPSDQTFLKKYETAFAGKADLLKDICAKIGGSSPSLTAGADVYWEFRLFPFLPGEPLNVFEGDWLKFGKSYGILLLIGLVFSTDWPDKLYHRFKDTVWGTIALLAIFWGSIYTLYLGLSDPFLYFRF